MDIKGYTEALKSQIDLLLHTSNLYYSRPAADAAAKLAKAAQMDRIFFTNSGTEAIEGALKAARKYAYTEGSGKFEIIAMEHSFHGRSMGALSVTATESYRTPFEPLIGGVKFARYNDLESVKEQFSDKTCAVIMETLQGEGGIYPIDPEFFRGVRELCDERGALLILDEIQCGMGRTGTMFAWQDYGVKPDIVTVAKALGCGVPVGAFAAKDEVAKALVPGDHGTTYGGNPLACAAAVKVFELFDSLKVLDNVKEVGAYLASELDKIVAEYDIATERRGMGLIQGLQLSVNPKDVIANALDKRTDFILSRNKCHSFCTTACYYKGRCGRDDCQTEKIFGFLQIRLLKEKIHAIN